MATILFVDTNFFLQLKDARALPWADISKEKELLLIVPRKVQTEIDGLKQDGNSRRSKRARKTSSFLRQVIQSPDGNVVIKESDPRVVMGFPPPGSLGKARPATLDPTRADDQIVGEVLDFITFHPTDRVFLLTNDTGPMLTARYHSVPFIEVPDTWLLDPEPDERDKIIQDLKRRLESLERTHPLVEVSAHVNGGQITEITEEVLLFEQLPENLIEHFMEEIRARCPVADEFGPSGTELLFRRTAAVGLGGHFRYTPQTADEIRDYREVRYPAWLAHMRQVLVDAPARLNERTRALSLQFRVANTGTLPANNALVEIEARGQVLIKAPTHRTTNSEDSASLHFPNPPEPPSGHFDETYSGLSAGSYLGAPRGSLANPEAIVERTRTVPVERNRNAFYWAVKKLEPSSFLSLTCEEFRHQSDVQEFNLIVILPQGKSVSGAVSCTFSAANLPEPARLVVPVKTSVTKGDTEKYLRDLILKLPRTVRIGKIAGLSFEV